MINKDRIVPVTATDLITLYSVLVGFMMQSNATLNKIDPTTVDGVFEFVEATTGPVILSQPAKEIKVASTVETVSFMFVPDYTFEGVTVDGVAMPVAEGSAAVEPDGYSFYGATVASGTVTYKKFGF